MSLRDSSGTGPARTRRRALIAGSSVVVLAAAAAIALATVPAGHPVAQHQATAAVKVVKGFKSARLDASTCSGPAGAAYVALPGYQAFDAIDTANCYITQTYNEADPQVPGFSGDTNYSGTDPQVAIHGDTLYFAAAGDDEVAGINAANLNPKDYSPPETDIHVGFDPSGLAVTPDGSQLWVADTGPQTHSDSPTAITVISTATLKVPARLRLP